jgi:hypothetical protein
MVVHDKFQSKVQVYIYILRFQNYTFSIQYKGKGMHLFLCITYAQCTERFSSVLFFFYLGT